MRMTVGPLRPWDGRCVKPPPPRRNLEDSLRMTLAIADEGGSWSLCRGRGIRGGLVLAAAGVAGCWQQAKLRRGPGGHGIGRRYGAATLVLLWKYGSCRCRTGLIRPQGGRCEPWTGPKGRQSGTPSPTRWAAATRSRRECDRVAEEVVEWLRGARDGRPQANGTA